MNRFNPTTGKPKPMGPPSLTRYGSAPGSLLANIADSVINSQGRTHGGGGGGGGEFSSVVGSEPMMSRFYPGESPGLTTTDSSCRTGPTVNGSYDFGGVHALIPDLSESHKPVVTVPPAPPLVRHSSSPAGLLSHLLVDPQVGRDSQLAAGASSGNNFRAPSASSGNNFRAPGPQSKDDCLSGTKGMGSYSHATTETVDLLTDNRLRPQWSFSRQDSLSQLSEMSIPDMGEGSWAENSSIFSNHLSKRGRDDSGDFIGSLGNMDEMSNMEYMQMQQDVATCKLRAKRGFATHPRSIAERERRTRISKRLRKLQELVPNMDKQTSTSDMLDFAVQYINDLQGQLQKIKEEQQKCTCSNKVL